MGKGAQYLCIFGLSLLTSFFCNFISHQSEGWISIVWFVMAFIPSGCLGFSLGNLWRIYKDYENILKDHEEETEWNEKKKYFAITRVFGASSDELTK